MEQDKPKLPKLSQLILEMISEEPDLVPQEPREIGVFRASELGNCPRRIQYAMRGYEQPGGIEPSLALLFKDGNMHHDAVRKDLEKVVKLTHVEEMFTKQYAYNFPEGDGVDFTIIGHTDGIVNDKYILDIKGINRFSYQAIAKVKDDWQKVYEYLDNSPFSRGNYPQLQTYMDGFDKEWGCLLFKCKDTSELMEVWFPRNRFYFYEKLLPELARIARATYREKWITKHSDGSSFNKRPYMKSSKECQTCPFKLQCWKE